MKKMLSTISNRNFLLTCVSIFFIFFGIACNDDSSLENETEKLIGTWLQTSRTIDGNTSTIDSTRLVMQLNDNKICLLCDSTSAAVKLKKIVVRSGWSYYEGVLNIAVDLPASWQTDAKANDLSIERADFNRDGTITKTILAYKRIENIEIE